MEIYNNMNKKQKFNKYKDIKLEDRTYLKADELNSLLKELHETSPTGNNSKKNMDIDQWIDYTYSKPVLQQKLDKLNKFMSKYTDFSSLNNFMTKLEDLIGCYYEDGIAEYNGVDVTNNELELQGVYSDDDE